MLLLCLLGRPAFAQDAPPDSEAGGEPESGVASESIERSGDEAVETVETDAPNTEETTEPAVETPAPWKPDPVGALWRSGLLAGLGQFYNEQWLKGALLMGCEAFTVYHLVHYAVEAGREFEAGRDIEIPEGLDSPQIDELREKRDDHFAAYEDHRVRYETYIWLTALVIVYSMLDAYVDAHLWDFEVDEDLDDSSAIDIELVPRLGPDGDGGWWAGLGLELSF